MAHMCMGIRDATIYRYIAYHIITRLYHNINTKLNCIGISIHCCITVSFYQIIGLVVAFQIKKSYKQHAAIFKLHHVSNNISLYFDRSVYTLYHCNSNGHPVWVYLNHMGICIWVTDWYHSSILLWVQEIVVTITELQQKINLV